MAEPTELMKKTPKAIAEVLERHNVFGLERDAWTDNEKKHFVEMVMRHVLDTNLLKGEMVLNYHDTSTRIELNAVLLAGRVRFPRFKVAPFLPLNATRENEPQIDYATLQADVVEVIKNSSIQEEN